MLQVVEFWYPNYGLAGVISNIQFEVYYNISIYYNCVSISELNFYPTPPNPWKKSSEFLVKKKHKGDKYMVMEGD